MVNDLQIRHFADLRVWQLARQLVSAMYRVTQQFPREEIYGLTSQIRRAAVSTAANIAEGSKRKTSADLRHFLTMAETSNEEVKCLIILAGDLGFLTETVQRDLLNQCGLIGAMLNSLSHKLPPT